MQLSAQDSKERKSAKSALKQKILAAFQSEKEMSAEELKGFSSLFKGLATGMAPVSNKKAN
jgi:hypothetical protein